MAKEPNEINFGNCQGNKSPIDFCIKLHMYILQYFINQ